jgi:hypothetical protein
VLRQVASELVELLSTSASTGSEQVLRHVVSKLVELLGVALCEEQFIAMTDFGENLGMSFQIADDILGMVGDEKKLGKPVGSDL